MTLSILLILAGLGLWLGFGCAFTWWMARKRGRRLQINALNPMYAHIQMGIEAAVLWPITVVGMLWDE